MKPVMKPVEQSLSQVLEWVVTADNYVVLIVALQVATLSVQRSSRAAWC